MLDDKLIIKLQIQIKIQNKKKMNNDLHWTHTKKKQPMKETKNCRFSPPLFISNNGAFKLNGHTNWL